MMPGKLHRLRKHGGSVFVKLDEDSNYSLELSPQALEILKEIKSQMGEGTTDSQVFEHLLFLAVEETNE